LILIPGALAFGASMLVALPGCSGDGGTPAASPTPSGPPAEQVLAQYRRLWAETIPAATKAGAADRRSILAVTMTDPALSATLARLAKLDTSAQIPYGSDIPLRQSVTVTGKGAVVRGCLDSSKSGLADRKTGQKLTRGIATNPVLVTFKQGPDGVWRVAATSFPGTRGC
jgi:hypothetical protein